MFDHRIARGALCLLMVAAVASRAMGQAFGTPPAAPPGPDPFVTAQHLFDAKQYLSARDQLKKFIGVSIGDARIPAAKKMMIDCWHGAADQLWSDGDFPDALAVWGGFATEYKDEKEGADAKTTARQKASEKFAELLKGKKFRAAIDVADAYKQSFAGEAALIDADVFQSACVEMLGQALKGTDPLNGTDLIDQVIADGVKEEQLQTAGAPLWAIRAATATALVQHNELNRAIALCNKSLAGCPADMKDKFQHILGPALVTRAEAYGKFGNLPMLEQAITDMDGAAVGPAGKATQTRLTDEVKKKVGTIGNAAHILKIEAPIVGNGKWSDDGAGYTIDGTVTLGDATITVAPGFVLDNGTIHVKRGSLDIQGTAAQPVILRNVHFLVELGGAVTAKGAIFEDCTFSWTGMWFSHYTSRWKFTDCLLSNSNFKSLSDRDYGIEISGCVVADCKIPARLQFGPFLGDAAQTYHDDGNQVLDDAFVRCEMTPSISWVTQRCYFEQCKVMSSEGWRSTTNLAVKLAVPTDEPWFVDRLKFLTTFEAQGGIVYNATAIAKPKANSLVFFQYVGMGAPAK